MIYERPFLQDVQGIDNAGILANCTRVCAIAYYDKVDLNAKTILTKDSCCNLNLPDDSYSIFQQEKYFIRCSGYAINGFQVLTTAHGLDPSFDGYVVFDFYNCSNTPVPRFCHFSSTDITKFSHLGSYEYDFAIINFREPIIKETLFDVEAFSKSASTNYAIGFPLGMKAVVSFAKDDTLEEEFPFFFMFLDMFSGSSGSPVFNKYHQFIGLFRTTTAADFVEDGSKLNFVVLPKVIPQKSKTIIMERMITNTLKSI